MGSAFSLSAPSLESSFLRPTIRRMRKPAFVPDDCVSHLTVERPSSDCTVTRRIEPLVLSARYLFVCRREHTRCQARQPHLPLPFPRPRRRTPSEKLVTCRKVSTVGEGSSNQSEVVVDAHCDQSSCSKEYGMPAPA